ncbi:hypothetical protein B0H14DRAFT_2571533 [Mycena olivaceomarginata]|nr:hypothetical protein B0H14DRAFT_2571533 [Mycena olivaceomarginata]
MGTPSTHEVQDARAVDHLTAGPAALEGWRGIVVGCCIVVIAFCIERIEKGGPGVVDLAFEFADRASQAKEECVGYSRVHTHTEETEVRDCEKVEGMSGSAATRTERPAEEPPRLEIGQCQRCKMCDMLCVHNANEIRKEGKVLQDVSELGDGKVGAGVVLELF